MSRNLKFFLVSFLLSLPFWWGINIFQKNLESFFYSLEFEKNPPSFFTPLDSKYLTGQVVQIAQNYPEVSEYKTSEYRECSEGENLQNPSIAAAASISVEIDPGGREKVLFEKNAAQKMPIASLTKLMTAIIASEFYHDSHRIEISKAAVSQPEESGNLTVGEILQVKDLLCCMLIESSNDAAFALSEPASTAGFTDLMNLKAKELGLNNTYFFNPAGIDLDDSTEESNYSTAQDLAKLTKYLLAEHPEILNILSKKEYDLYLENGVLHHTLENTNQLLGEIPEIIGGKTGYTEEAGGCLLLILKGKEPGTYLINVILNSQDRFGEMRQLIKYGLQLCSS